MQILIIEDFEGDIELLVSRLKAIGCGVLVARNAEDGLRMAKTEKPALILTDLNLGAGIEEGIEMISDLRADPETASIPLIIHSVFVSRSGDMGLASAQADGFLPKPYKFMDLAKLVQKLAPSEA
ncbi:MAG: response regulator [Candidatus Sericytochromatia bacterium]